MHNGYTYKFDYDGLNRNTSIIAGDTTLVSLAYTLGKTSTVKSTYGNGFTTVVTSDSRDNPINKTVNDTEISAAEYDEVGNPVKLLDKIRNICYTYQYDSDGNVISVTEAPISGSGTKVENTTTYDEVSGRVTRKKYGAVGHEYVPIYETDSEGHIYPDNVEVGVKLVNQYTDVTQRDNYGRTTLRTLTKSGNSKALITEAYQYYVNNVTNASHRETNFVETHQQTIGDDISKFEYTYDDSGNIATVKKDGKDFAKYTYDGLNRLIQEDNFQFMRSYTWTYDDGGNITEKRIYTLTASGAQGSLVNTVPYGYDSKWKDKLISYGDNKDFAYDALGNPTRYRGNALT